MNASLVEAFSIALFDSEVPPARGHGRGPRGPLEPFRKGPEGDALVTDRRTADAKEQPREVCSATYPRIYYRSPSANRGHARRHSPLPPQRGAPTAGRQRTAAVGEGAGDAPLVQCPGTLLWRDGRHPRRTHPTRKVDEDDRGYGRGLRFPVSPIRGIASIWVVILVYEIAEPTYCCILHVLWEMSPKSAVRHTQVVGPLASRVEPTAVPRWPRP